MAVITQLLSALDERRIAQEIGIPHDETRMRYRLDSNTVGNFEEFEDKISEYYNYHFTQCISHGGSLSRSEASGRAKEILEREYRRRNGTIVTAYNDAHDGTNGGLRAILDMIAEGIKAEAITRYIRDVFDRYVSTFAVLKISFKMMIFPYTFSMFTEKRYTFPLSLACVFQAKRSWPMLNLATPEDEKSAFFSKVNLSNCVFTVSTTVLGKRIYPLTH